VTFTNHKVTCYWYFTWFPSISPGGYLKIGHRRFLIYYSRLLIIITFMTFSFDTQHHDEGNMTNDIICQQCYVYKRIRSCLPKLYHRILFNYRHFFFGGGGPNCISDWGLVALEGVYKGRSHCIVAMVSQACICHAATLLLAANRKLSWDHVLSAHNFILTRNLAGIPL
jgi:hypothetical protein